MTPDEIREHAIELILEHARDIEPLTIRESFEDKNLSPEDEDRIADEIDDLIRDATITVELPEETDREPNRPRLRMGASWSRKGGMATVIAEGTGPADEQGRRPRDRLIGVMADPEWAALVVRAVNALEESR